MNQKKIIIEFIGTFFLMLICTMLLKSAKATGFEGLVIGALYMALVYANQASSGAFFNPAITLANFIKGLMTLNELVAYVATQLIAAIFAIYSADAMLQGIATGNDNLPLRIDPLPSFLAEFFGTFLLVYVFLSVSAAIKNQNNSFFGAALGGTLVAISYAFAPVSGGAFNPAIAIGYCIGNIAEWSTSWTYFVGELLASVVATIIFKYLENEIN
jgi:aquaporin Z